MLNKIFIVAASAGLLFALASTAAQAQANWTKGMAYRDSSFTLSNGPGQSNSDSPATDLKVSASYDPTLRMGANDASGGTTVYQPYYWNGGSTRTPLNIQVNIGASGSGSGSYQVTSDAHVTLPNGYVSGAGGSASNPQSFSLPSNNNPPSQLQAWYDVAGSNSTCGQSTNAGWVDSASVSADARMYGQGSQALAEALVIFGQPFYVCIGKVVGHLLMQPPPPCRKVLR